MEGFHVIIFISQNRNPNFPQTLTATINLHGSRRRFRPLSGFQSPPKPGTNHRACTCSIPATFTPISPESGAVPSRTAPRPWQQHLASSITAAAPHHHCSQICTVPIAQHQQIHHANERNYSSHCSLRLSPSSPLQKNTKHLQQRRMQQLSR